MKPTTTSTEAFHAWWRDEGKLLAADNRQNLFTLARLAFLVGEKHGIEEMGAAARESIDRAFCTNGGAR